MKIRNKLIKLLKGYTKEEYDILNNPIHIHPFTATPVSTQKFKVCYASKPWEPPVPEEYIRSDLASQLTSKLVESGFIIFSTSQSEYNTPKTTATLFAVKYPSEENPYD